MTCLVIVLSAILSASVAGASTDGCPQIVLNSSHFAKVFNSTCYVFVNNELYWNDARESCWKMGGEMLSVRNEETMNFIRSVLDQHLRWGKNGVWLGARYFRGRWRWTTGEIVQYNYWADGEPSKILGLFSAEDCALMRRSDQWRWHDYLCNTMRFHYNYICQFRLEPTTTTTTTSTTTTRSPKIPVGSQGDGPQGGHHYQPWDLRGQEVHSMVLDHSAQGGVAGHPFQQHPAFNYHGQHSSHFGTQPQDNGNMAILTIILVTGGIILLILLLVFLIFRRRYSRKFRQEPVVNFENRTYCSQPREPLPPPPTPHHIIRPRPSSNLYLTPMEAAPLYEEVQKPNGFVVGSKDSDHLLGTPPLPPPPYSDESLGACGGDAALDEVDDPKAPLVCGAVSEESLDSMKKGCSIKMVNIHNDYVDMNGSPVSSRSSRNGDGGSIHDVSKHSQDPALDDKQAGYYSNLSTQQATCENVYEQLP